MYIIINKACRLCILVEYISTVSKWLVNKRRKKGLVSSEKERLILPLLMSKGFKREMPPLLLEEFMKFHVNVTKNLNIKDMEPEVLLLEHSK